MHGVISVPLVSFRVEAAHRPSLWVRLGRRSRQSKRFSPLSSWVRFSLWIRVKRVSQHSAESRGFSPVASQRESWQGGLNAVMKVISQLL